VTEDEQTPPEDETGAEHQGTEPPEPQPADEPQPEAPEEPEAPELSEEAVVPSAPQPPQAPDEPEAAEQPAEEIPVPQEPSAAEEPPAAQPPAAAEETAEELDEEYEPAPRQRPEIPGADLIPDIAPEADEYMDAEARAAAEAEAEARAARELEERDQEAETQPIADAAIDLAAGARYTATGKRKSAVARVILKPGDGSYAINGKGLEAYFPRETLQRVIRQPLEMVGYEARMDVVARMHGGGVAAQAEALRHGISRALIVADPHLRSELKRRGFLTRDPRVKERKKAGLKKARKRPQFSKR
jgi:small subunit ribosomal protein S9